MAAPQWLSEFINKTDHEAANYQNACFAPSRETCLMTFKLLCADLKAARNFEVSRPGAQVGTGNLKSGTFLIKKTLFAWPFPTNENH